MLKGNIDCQLALAMNAYRIRKYIGSYAAMNGLDALFSLQEWEKIHLILEN
jgi:acetate kinase